MPSLVIQTSFLGDMVLTTPLLAHLARRGPVDVLATPAAGALLAQNPSVRAVLPYDKRRRDRGIAGFARLASRLRRKNYDIAYLAQGSLRSAALAVSAGIPHRVGFDTSAGRALYTRRVPYDDTVHHAARLLALGVQTSESPLTPDQLRPRLYPSITEVSAVDALLAEAKHERGTPLIALAPGSVWATKRWPYYAELARSLTARGVRVVVIGSKEDHDLAKEIAAAVRAGRGAPAIDATGRLSLLASAELIGRAQAIVTNDSAPQHLASAMGTPTVTLFGPTVPEFGFGPLAAHHAALGVDTLGVARLDCRPCDRHGPQRCPLGHWRCMKDMTAPLVAKVLETL
ncbi:MAG TPA: lipopolysaccharide heptosyltransferase II [Gemmatimonadaceae bacterium]|nr:lipopolysaccharide heptosyltransferase II [Gemmatimonadaceae bacterium]